MNPLKVETKWYHWLWLTPLFLVLYVCIMSYQGVKHLYVKGFQARGASKSTRR